MRRRRALPILLTTLAVMPLCGCASEETASRILVAPDQYILFNCAQIANEADGIAKRQRELEALMKKAGGDAGGRFVSSQVYGPEYTQLRGQMVQLRKTATEKNCTLSGGVSGVSGRPPEQRTLVVE